MRLGKRWFTYGEYEDQSPDHLLAIAVIERCLVDAVGGACIPHHITADARRDLFRPANQQLFSLYWWISCVYENPDCILSAFRRAITSGEASGMKYRNGRRHRVGRAEWVHRKKPKKDFYIREKNVC